MTKKQYFTKNPEMLCEKVDDVGVILFDEENRNTHLLNQSAALIWELIDKNKDIYQVFDLYTKHINFDEVSKNQVESDFYQTINLLKEKNIIKELRYE